MALYIKAEMSLLVVIFGSVLLMVNAFPDRSVRAVQEDECQTILMRAPAWCGEDHWIQKCADCRATWKSTNCENNPTFASRCKAWQESGACSSAFVGQHCPNTCGRCTLKTRTEVLTVSTEAPTVSTEAPKKSTVPTSTDKPCADHSFFGRFCPNFASRGQCYRPNIKKNCPLSCKVCNSSKTVAPKTAAPTPKQTAKPATTNVPTASTSTPVPTTTKPAPTKPKPVSTTTKPIPTTKSTTTDKPTVAPTTTQKPRPFSCDVCDPAKDGSCTARNEVCDADKQFCMNTLTDRADGKRVVKKSCVTKDVCVDQYYRDTYDKNDCLDLLFDVPVKILTKCNFCCVTPGCNMKDVPLDNSLYEP